MMDDDNRVPLFGRMAHDDTDIFTTFVSLLNADAS
jgi:hypothetical protein